MEKNTFICDCAPGFLGSGCDEPDDCYLTKLCQNNTTCHDHDGTNNYTCQCIPGFTGMNCETDVEECESNP